MRSGADVEKRIATDSRSRLEAALEGVSVRSAMLSRFGVLAPDDPARRAIELSLISAQGDFPVVADGRPVGLLTRADVLWVSAANRPSAPVCALMREEFGVVTPADTLATATALARGRGLPLLVVDRGQLVGILTADSFAQAMAHGGGRAELATTRGPEGAPLR